MGSLFNSENSTSASNGNVNNIRKFSRINDPLSLVPILESRLPTSAPLFNAAQLTAWHEEQEWYTLDGDSPANTWICVKILRSDFGQEILISSPPKNRTIPHEIQAAFSSCDWINWDSVYVFAVIEPEVSKMLTDISIREKGNCVIVHPCNLYYMNVEEGCQLNTNFSLDEGVQVKSINDDLGVKFILDTWKYAAEGSDIYVKKVLSRAESSGVYIDGTKVVSGVGLVSHGLIGMLHTLKEARGKGYGKYTMHNLMKKMSEKGLLPSCTVELRNTVSKTVQEKLGFKVASVVDFIVFENSGF